MFKCKISLEFVRRGASGYVFCFLFQFFVCKSFVRVCSRAETVQFSYNNKGKISRHKEKIQDVFNTIFLHPCNTKQYDPLCVVFLFFYVFEIFL